MNEQPTGANEQEKRAMAKIADYCKNITIRDSAKRRFFSDDATYPLSQFLTDNNYTKIAVSLRFDKFYRKLFWRSFKKKYPELSEFVQYP